MNEQQWPEEVRVEREDIMQARESAHAGKRKQKTWYLSEEVIERANAAVYWALPYALKEAGNREVDVSRLPDSASALVEAGLWSEVLRLERMLNNGEPFPKAPGALRTGPGRTGIQRLSQPRRAQSEPTEPESVEGHQGSEGGVFRDEPEG